jgi:large subunit ribosomal protein L31
MKEGIHPEYRKVLFHDTSVDEYFIIPSTIDTDQTKEWKDGETYPYYPLDVSSASHPFYTGEHKIVDTGGRVDRFKKRFAKTTGAAVSARKEEAPVEEAITEEAPVEDVIAEEAPVEEAITEEAPVEDVIAEEAPVEEANDEALENKD